MKRRHSTAALRIQAKLTIIAGAVHASPRIRDARRSEHRRVHQLASGARATTTPTTATTTTTTIYHHHHVHSTVQRGWLRRRFARNLRSRERFRATSFKGVVHSGCRKAGCGARATMAKAMA